MASPHSKVRASILTPLGEGGIGIIALVGEEAAAVLDRFFVGTRRGTFDIRPGSIAHGRICDGGRTIDEVIVARPDAAGEPCFEVNCHGGVVAVRSVLDCFARAGVEVVDWKELDWVPPGEGRGEPPVLSEAQIRRRALARLPRALTRLAVAMLLHQAGGALTAELRAIRAALAQRSAQVAAKRLEGLLATAPFGKALLHPWRVAIVGPPNAGKSTLLNALLRRERVLVHHRPGTTRDVVSELVSMDGVPLELLDSAGIRRPRGEIEADAVARAKDLVGRSEIILLVYDVRGGARRVLAAVPSLPARATVLLVGNKIDLIDGVPASEALPAELSECPRILISAKEGTNLSELETALLEPLSPFTDRCRNGGAIIFEDEIEAPVRAGADALREEGPAEALRVLDTSTGTAREAGGA